MATFKVPNSVIPNRVYSIEETYTQEHKKLVKEANEKIAEERRNERKAWEESNQYFSMNHYNQPFEEATTIETYREEKSPRLIKKQ